MEHDGYFSAEEQVTSDPEEEKEDKLVQDHVCFLLLDEKAKGCHVFKAFPHLYFSVKMSCSL